MHKKQVIIVSVVLAPLFIAGLFLFKASHVLTIIGSFNEESNVYENFHVEPEDDRIDILLLGIRGAGEENGGLLADTIILVSFDKKKEKASIVSLPRDLFVEMPNYLGREKLNFAYALGEERRWGGGGLTLSKQVVQYVTGVYVDYAVVINFDGFVRIIDLLGGVQVSRTYDFVEAQQWQGEGREDNEFWYKEIVQDDEGLTGDVGGTSQDDPEAFDGVVEGEIVETTDEGSDLDSEEQVKQEYWVFHVPAGTSTLDGEDALYYARSRFSSSDFDRMKRQQQVISSLKAKALSLGVLSNPLKIFNLIDTLGNNVRTDMGLGDMREVIFLTQKYSSASVKTVSLDVSQDSLLEATFIDGQYVIVPRSGDFSELRTFFTTIFE